MQDFVYQSAPMRVVFGAGTLRQLPYELSHLGVTSALVLATPRQKDLVAGIREMIGERFAGVFTGAVMHTPVEVTERAMETVRDMRADGLVAIGGGSTTGLGKAIALRTDLPQIVLPTSYSGSEMTPVVGQTSGGIKTTQSSPKILPETVIYDVDLTMTMPPKLSATSGINAIAHAVEALYARDRNPLISLMAEEGIRALAQALPTICAQPNDKTARTGALYGAWLCGICLGAVGMALHHKLCHALGGLFNLPHAETHTVVLPHALAYNAPAAPDAMAQVAAALGEPDPALGLQDLARKLGSPLSLREIGMPESGIDQAADLAVKNPYWNPRPIERAAIRELIARAWRGDAPRLSCAGAGLATST
ncbi:maleylacetate reductase [Bradyrhizobium archetypum]|uniref:Maleylacetate reductase n=1 Tax=Bradyrhizobium archetypum TaxID=2721160 RepID=A0A7Y4M3Y9_9BRAD|nr:maleylacetate reductase [Bradyrhizobium archetypum]NOJ48525.1 maleylacetate reductase [Bradyrhizobium archetypum]